MRLHSGHDPTVVALLQATVTSPRDLAHGYQAAINLAAITAMKPVIPAVVRGI